MRLASLTSGLLAVALFVSVRDAAACGGCFHEPTRADAATTQSGTVVTDHRMAIAMTSQGTTLWDQIEYVGDPGEFVWVLPIQGAVQVSVGSDAFLESLDQITAPRINGPRVYCNPPPSAGPTQGYGGGSGGSDSFGCGCGSTADEYTAAEGPRSEDAGASAADDGGLAADEGVTITHREAVGPYETVQITGDGTESILGWLRRNGYEVPASVEPMVQKYVDEKFGFLAVRLKPGAGVQAMKPIRVSWKGRTPQLPLRMVAAGVGESVGLKLFVIGDGRWRAQNFDTFTIADTELTWDFKASRSDYTEVRAKHAADEDGRAWALEASVSVNVGSVSYVDPQPADAGESEVSVDPALDSGEDGAATATTDSGASDSVATDTTNDGDAAADADSDLPPIPVSATDVDVAFAGEVMRRVTRLRADLPARHLGVDLVLEADEDQSFRPATYTVKTWKNAEGLCEYGIASVDTSAFPLGAAPAKVAPAAAKTAACTLGEPERPIRISLVGLGGLAMLGLLRRRKRA